MQRSLSHTSPITEGDLTIVAQNPAHIANLLTKGLTGQHDDAILPPQTTGPNDLLITTLHRGLHYLTVPQVQCAEAICSQCLTTVCAACNDTVAVRLNGPVRLFTCGPCEGIQH